MDEFPLSRLADKRIIKRQAAGVRQWAATTPRRDARTVNLEGEAP